MKRYSILVIYQIILVILFVVFIGRLFQLQIMERNSEDKINNRMVNVSVKSKRGSIISSDGQTLAYDVYRYNVKISPVNVPVNKIVPQIAYILEKYTGIDNKEIREKIFELKENNKKEYDLKVKLTNEEKENLNNELKNLLNKSKLLSTDGIKRSQEKSKKYIFFEELNVREYIEYEDFKNILGYLNVEDKGVYGLESYYNDYLSGTDGVLSVYRPAIDKFYNKTPQTYTYKKVLKEVKDGDNLILNIDSVLQYYLNDVLKDTYEKTQAESVMAILMEVDTANVLAMGSYPTANNKANIKNKNITDLFEPGSIFKPITVASAINENLINENSVISSDGYIKVKDRIIHDHDNTTVGSFPLSKIMALSGNVAMVKIGMMMDDERYYNYLNEFGLGNKTGIDTNFETNGRLFTKKGFTEVRKSNVSFGQGINMTQLQMLTALNATINGGKILKPHIVSKIVSSNGDVVVENKPEIISTPISEKTSRQIRNMLRDVVVSGTGKKVEIPGYELGGKTGTAQKAGNSGYIKGAYFSSFFAFFPVENPKYSVLITVNEPKGIYYGAQVALPGAKAIIEKLINYKSIEPSYIPEVKEENKLEEKEKVIKESLKDIEKDLKNKIMPNLTGLSLKELLELNLYESYPNFNIVGSGVVVRQNIKSGQEIDYTSKIEVELE